VGIAVRTITQHLDALKNGVVAAQQPEEGQALINEQTAAHLHGSVSHATAHQGIEPGKPLLASCAGHHQLIRAGDPFASRSIRSNEASG